MILLKKNKSGFTLVETLVATAVFGMITYALYTAFFSILESTTKIELREEAVSVIENEIEIIRNMPYEDIGISGGYPVGKLLAEKIIPSGNLNFQVKTTVRNVDDAFDGTLGGNPNDTAPADYKIIEFEVNCLNCERFVPFTMTTTIAPKGLESASNNGSLFINVFDASGQPVSGANVNVINASASPPISLNDITNNNGVLQLVDFPTSTLAYQINVSKSGYSSDKTYSMGDANNPNPLKPHATVVEQQVTAVSFQIDKTSSVNLITADKMCQAVGNIDYSQEGAKLIGANPDVIKYSTTSATDLNGQKTIGNLEWDTYNFINLDAAYDIAGTSPLLPLTVNPDTSSFLRLLMKLKNSSALLVSAVENNQPVGGVSVNLQKSGFDETLLTEREIFSQSNWSGGQYNSQSGAIDDGVFGEITLALTNGKYPTSTVAWLISDTFDLGTSTTIFDNIVWNPEAQPGQTGSDSLKFQIATNNDNATWNFFGPDGTGNTFYITTSTQINTFHNNNRYFRYKVFMKTDDENYTPKLENIDIRFSSGCLPVGQAFFNGLSFGNYELTAQKSGYQLATSTVSVLNDWQEYKIEMIKL